MTVDCLGGIGPVKSFIAPTYWLKSEIDVKLAVLLPVIIFPLYRPLVWEKSYSTVSTNFEIFYLFYATKKSCSRRTNLWRQGKDIAGLCEHRFIGEKELEEIHESSPEVLPWVS